MKNIQLYKWEVPDYDIMFLRKKTKDYSLIIPVINEGLRIKSFLKKIYKNSIFNLVDIFIVDGGSTDGSLIVNDLKKMKITGFLKIKNSFGLSSQLRVGYSLSLNMNYKGIVTIDGNDKDDPKFISTFIHMLDEGFDFVQASRFVKGGVGINTPAIRRMAIKYIHAPLLSFCSGFKWTDTTQGFRGYSAKLLKNKKLRIFREVFKNYELLFFITYAAPKLGLKCVELATTRKYKEKKVNTKIKGVSGNFKVFYQLIMTCLGKFNYVE